MRHLVLIIGLLFQLSGLSGQAFVIQGNIEYAGPGVIYLASYYGEKFEVTDSMETSAGSFYFLLQEDAPVGIYRLVYPEVYQGVLTENQFVEFICNRENLTINVSREADGPLPSFDNSMENLIYFEYMAFQMDYEAKLRALYERLTPARPGDTVYDAAVLSYETLQRGRIRYMDSLTVLYPDLYATRLMNAFHAPVAAGSISHNERIESLKQTFFAGNAIDDPDLLYAPVYTFRIIDYLSLYRVDTFSMERQQQAFVEAVDQIMISVAAVPELRSFVVEFLLEGFEMLDMEMVQFHLAENYLDESCESDVAELVRNRMEGFRRMAVGSTAPDIVVRDMKGKIRRLSDIPSSYVLVLFWASTCTHCTAMIPELNDWYLHENDLDVEVLAISIDSLAANFAAYTRENEMPWITSHEQLGWNGKVPGDYHIYATPSMFLLDKEQKILARPVNMKQLRKSLKKLGI